MVAVDLSSPLRSIAPGLDSAVLQVLAGTHSGLSASQIARLAPRGSRTGLLPVLDRLVGHGLVIAEPANQGYLYRLNREHVLADAVLIATAARSSALDRLAAVVGALGPHLIHASVFGSFARADGDADSDVDLLLVTRDDDSSPEWVERLHRLGDSVLAWTGNRLEHVVLSMEQMSAAVASGEPVVSSWLDEAVTLHGPSIQTLVQEGARSLTASRQRG
jgi:predicted nucleotidyltransferase